MPTASYAYASAKIPKLASNMIYFILHSTRTSPFKVTNQDTLFQCCHLELPTWILDFLKVEITNLRSEFHHLERANPKIVSQLNLFIAINFLLLNHYLCKPIANCSVRIFYEISSIFLAKIDPLLLQVLVLF